MKKVFTAAIIFDVASAVHPERAKLIATLQNTPGMLWTVDTKSRFSSEAPGASKSLCGLRDDWKEALNESIAKGDVKMQESKLKGSFFPPENFDSKLAFPECAPVIGDILDQSATSCCWAFAGGSAAADRMCIATKGWTMVPFSQEDVCFCAINNGCVSGGQLNSAFQYIQQNGVVTGSRFQGTGAFGEGMCADFTIPPCNPQCGPSVTQCPQCPSSCAFTAVPPHNDFYKDKYSFRGDIIGVSGEAQIMEAIMSGGPMVGGLMIYEDFEIYQYGIYQHVYGKKVGGHAVKIVGWGLDLGTKYWKIQNSWSENWGERGYVRMVRGINDCEIEHLAVASSPFAQWGKMHTLGSHTDSMFIA